MLTQIRRWQARLSRFRRTAAQSRDESFSAHSELFSAEQMALHGGVLAKTHQLATGHPSDRLLDRLADNERFIANTCAQLTASIRAGTQVTPAAVWLLDNYYLIDEQIRTAKLHLPKNYSKQLPRLLNGSAVGQPRVYDIAQQTIAHGDGRVDPEILRHFVAAYQQVCELRLGELWAIPIMLRLALIENLRRVAARLQRDRMNRNLAATWAKQMVDTVIASPNQLILLVADMARSDPPMESAFVAELVRKLQGENPALALPMSWLSQRLSESNNTIDNMVQSESQTQAADQVSISNSISSLRLLSNMDWQEFVESMSSVNRVLADDPAQCYLEMDFGTRDQYRHTVETISHISPLSELDIARQALLLATAGHGRKAHIGYYLVDQGIAELKIACGVRHGIVQNLLSACQRHRVGLYLGGVVALTGLCTAAIVPIMEGVDDAFVPLLLLLGMIAISHFSVAMVNLVSAMAMRPRLLPRMDFSKGIPARCHTLVVVPSLVYANANIDQLLAALELRFLANQDLNLRFCLVTDFTDAPAETMPGDQELLAHLRAGIQALNVRYQHLDADYFMLLHRPRSWNPHDKVWMGYERKRGKLTDLNNLLWHGIDTAFSTTIGDLSDFSVKYVITLDTDTELPRDAARKIVGTMAHPLNQPQFSEDGASIVAGYGVLQPSVTVCQPGTEPSLYEMLYGGEAGIDPYTRSVSNVYQDLFGEGSFIGKGIYDVEAFSRIMEQRIPDNRVLSHDLLEGCYIRSGLLSDVCLYEKYPSTYEADMRRRFRWIRGDWQIASWILSTVPGLNRHTPRPKNTLSVLSRWKILDNLRRSLAAPALTILLIAGWAVTDLAWRWTVLALLIYLAAPLGELVARLFSRPDNVTIVPHVRTVLNAIALQLVHSVLTLCFLPFEAWINLSAICKTHWRILISHRRLLEWSPSGDGPDRQVLRWTDYVKMMWSAPWIAVMTTGCLLTLRPMALIAASPILVLWALSPLVAFLISRPSRAATNKLVPDEIDYLNRLARKIWHFFETYVGPADHWLPPDNVQEQPTFRIAHRTSPTNIGLLLTTNFAAHDFGYIGTGSLLSRTASTLATMGKLERYQGHFYNWISTETLQPLMPRYVSTVDSGNLIGHLMTARAGLLALLHQPVWSLLPLAGIRDTFTLIVGLPGAGALRDIRPFEDALQTAAHLDQDNLCAARASLVLLTQCAEVLARQPGSDVKDIELMQGWLVSLNQQCHDALDDLDQMFPWVHLLDPNRRDLSAIDLFSRSTLVQLTQLTVDSDLLLAFRDDLLPNQIDALNDEVCAGLRNARQRRADIEQMAAMMADFANMDFSFLYNPVTHLLAIGYNVSDRRRDSGYYDLLASEARLTTFVAIAQGRLPQESWFALSRQLTSTEGLPVLLSWSGSMFEYLMPLLIMPDFDHTLLNQTYHAAVQCQINYGLRRCKYWGISESGYHTFDANLNYQYRAFGVPGSGFKRGLGEDLVIAPYASVMALMVQPDRACQNLMALSADGYEGRFGMVEAIDFTPVRMTRGRDHAVIASFMAHHQAMSFLALAYVLRDRPMQRRFESDPSLQATLPLLMERVPRITSNYAQSSELVDIRTSLDEPILHTRTLYRPDTSIPEVQLLSNGRYHVMVTNGGGSYSQWANLAITRWREDVTRDNWGTFCFVRDLSDGQYFSTGYQPTGAPATHYEVIFSEGRVEFRRSDSKFDVHTEIVVSPEDDVELRRTTIINRSRVRRNIDVTSYAEVVLAAQNADAMHPAFSNLFIQTEILAASQAILCSRRSGSPSQSGPVMFHLLKCNGATVVNVSYETDRLQFIGRTNTISTPLAMTNKTMLSGTQGSVLDPVAAIRYQILLEPEQSVVIDLITGMAESRSQCLELVNKFQDQHLAYRVIELAWTHSQVVLRQLNASEADAQLYNRLASSIIYANPALRADAATLIRNRRGQSGLWSYTISGDLPIVLVQIKSIDNIGLIYQMVQAHSYWSSRGLAVDLVIWNDDHAAYRQVMQDQILGLVSSASSRQTADRPGGIFVRIADQITPEDRVLFQSVARIILNDSAGTLAEQVNRRDTVRILPANLIVTNRTRDPAPVPGSDVTTPTGAFSDDGREFVIHLDAGQSTPAPWCNVIANAEFGTVISESGQAYTWGENAHEFRLSPWDNDPVCDGSGEALYLRDEESGKYWSPSALPCRGSGRYTTRHGFGYSEFTHSEDGLESTLTVYVAVDASVKYSVLTIRNNGPQARRLSVTGYVEWVLGDLRSRSAMHLCTEVDTSSGALLARNPYNTEFSDRVAFFQVNAPSLSFTADRNEFIGRNRSLQKPAAMERVRLSGKVGASLDPCAALMVPLDIGAGEQRQLTFVLGMANTRRVVLKELIQRHAGAANAARVLQQVREFWQRTLSAVQVRTPDNGLNFLANGWLPYQTIACRLWARSGYYQSGGAFGFRDQLQDCMALVHHAPHLLRDHLLLCAAHQFVEGDVQHWWHPPGNRGVRTQCTDDLLWLPLAVLRYVDCTGDMALLQESVPLLEGRALNAQESSSYDTPTVSARTATLYEHCKLSIRHALRFGAHGLSLIGSCDWNDGMDRVGPEGRGESVWLSFFLYQILTGFAALAASRPDSEFGAQCSSVAAELKESIDSNAWDGEWYRRAYFDDGSPLGSASNQECQIDSLPQSWAVLSGAGDRLKMVTAMQSMRRRLVSEKDQLVKLLDPPFDVSQLDPGYIRGYVPGVRENGGQYTHAAIWAAMAFAKLDDRLNAWTLLDMINPLRHNLTAAATAVYKVEPYVVAADVYATPPHTGRGGWTWYTGSSGWMMRLIQESLLGITLQDDLLTIRPCIPDHWEQYQITYRFHATTYLITVNQLDNQHALPTDNTARLIDDGQVHHLVFTTFRKPR